MSTSPINKSVKRDSKKEAPPKSIVSPYLFVARALFSLVFHTHSKKSMSGYYDEYTSKRGARKRGAGKGQALIGDETRGGGGGAAAGTSVAAIVIGSLALVLVLALGGWTIAQQVQGNNTRAQVDMNQMIIDSLVMPALNNTDPFEIANFTATATYQGISFTAQGPPPVGPNVVDANWDISLVPAGDCRLLKYNVGGIIWGVVEYLPNSVSLPLASDADQFVSIFYQCDVSFPNAAVLLPTDITDNVPAIEITPAFTVTDTQGTAPTAYPFFDTVGTNNPGAFTYRLFSHSVNCGASNVPCNILPAGTTVAITSPIRRLTFVQVP